MRPTRSTPAATRSCARVRISGVPCRVNAGRALRPIGVSTEISRWKITRNSTGRIVRRTHIFRMSNGTCPGMRPESQHAAARLQQVHRDLGPRIPGAHDQHVAVRQL
mgnify:CR=1 FL=1